MARASKVRLVTMLHLVKWLPHLMLVFGVFLAETSLQLHIFENGYAQEALRKESRAARLRINVLDQKIDRLENMKRMVASAAELGLVPPEPDQIEIVRPSFQPLGGTPHPGMSLASVRLPSDGGGVTNTESRPSPNEPE